MEEKIEVKRDGEKGFLDSQSRVKAQMGRADSKASLSQTTTQLRYVDIDAEEAFNGVPSPARGGSATRTQNAM